MLGTVGNERSFFSNMKNPFNTPILRNNHSWAKGTQRTDIKVFRTCTMSALPSLKRNSCVTSASSNRTLRGVSSRGAMGTACHR